MGAMVKLETVAMLPSQRPLPQHNHLLRSLSRAECDRVCPNLELVYLPTGTVLYELGDALQYVYFPTYCIVSLLNVLESGASTEISVVGKDGMIGIPLFMGSGTSPNRVVVQCAGYAYRMLGSFLKREFRCSSELQKLLLLYTQERITQMAQTAVCNRYHTVDQQLCRCLLMSLDRLTGSELKMTQELIANLLGVRREGVTEAAGRLQRVGVIHYSRGRITVLDRPRLESLCCECYAVVRKETDRIHALIQLQPLDLTDHRPAYPVASDVMRTSRGPRRLFEPTAK